ncbi:ATP synthase d chain [Serratia symbiotica str. 'Cinara cedri']|nr:ATP synthase d chain [Serratia symbiotica str. 'Cinara cedri']
MSQFITIARPYAKAAFNFALEHKSLNHWQEMLTFAAFVTCNKQLSRLLSSMIAPHILSKIYIFICGDQLDKYGQAFIRIMAENRRLLVLPAVLRQFIELRATFEATATVDILSAYTLNDAQRSKIIMAIEKRLSRKVILNYKIDKSLLAGFIIRFEDMVIDGSVRNRLERLTDVLQS